MHILNPKIPMWNSPNFEWTGLLFLLNKNGSKFFYELSTPFATYTEGPSDFTKIVITLTYISYYNFRSLVKRVNVGLSVQPIEDEMVEEIMVQGGSVSPIVTIEPRRRKFHKAITVSVPLPERISSAYLRKKQETSCTKNDRTIAPKKMPIGKLLYIGSPISTFFYFPIKYTPQINF